MALDQTNVMRLSILIFLCFFLMFPSSKGQQIDDSLLVASLSRTTCYGNCPYYEIKVYANGIATYLGKKNVLLIGFYKATINENIIEQILNKALQIKYMSLNNKYPLKGIGIIDFPVCITSIKTKKGKKKTIYNRNDSPQKLIEFQNFFDKLFEETEWKKI